MRLVTRAQWSARPAKNRTALVVGQQQGTAVHYSAADADEQASHQNCAGRVRGIQRFHLDGRGWSDIAYSYLVCKHGYVFEGRGRGIRTAAQGTNAGNDAFHAVCFLGDDTAGRDDVTDVGRLAILMAIRHCNAWAGVGGVRPHSSFKSTGCPGDDLRGWIARGLPTSPAAPPEEVDDMTKEELVEVLRAALSPGFDTVSEWAAQLNDVKRSLDGPQKITLSSEALDFLAKQVANHLEVQGHPEYEGQLVLTPKQASP